MGLGSQNKKPSRNQAESFLVLGHHFSKKNQHVASKKVVSILQLLTVCLTGTENILKVLNNLKGTAVTLCRVMLR